jgi:large repetitive protein
VKSRGVALAGSIALGFTLLGLLDGRAFAGTLPVPLEAPNGSQGYGGAVALSPDGSIAVVSANNPSNNNAGLNTNVILVWQFSDGAWSAAPIMELQDPAYGSDTQDQFGAAIAMSAITNNSFTLAVGSSDRAVVHGEPILNGVVFLYSCTLNAPAGCTQVAYFSDPVAAASPSDHFGSALAISQDGNTVLVGAWGTVGAGGAGVGNVYESNVGAAYVYIANGGNWLASPTATLSEGAATCASLGSSAPQIVCDRFGYAVALSAAGNAALVGAPGAVFNSQPNEGNAFVYQTYSGQWQTMPVTTLYNANGTACSNPAAQICDFYGAAVALSADASTALVGAPNAMASGASAGDLGEVSVFHQLVAGTWAGVTSPLIIYSNPNQNPSGTAFSASQAVQNYGSSLALSNDGTTLAVGSAQALQSSGVYSGVIDNYVCNFSTSPNCVNTPAQVLDTRLPVGSGDLFGSAVAMSTDATVVLAGAPATPSTGAGNSGAAYVFGAPGAQAALSLTLSAAPYPAAPGGNLTYNLTATNTDNLAIANALTLTVSLPAGVSYSSYNTAAGTCNASGNPTTVTCTLAALAAGATWQLSVVAATGTTPAALPTSATLTSGSALAKAYFTPVVDVPPSANNGQIGVLGGAATSGTLGATPGSISTLTYSIVAQPSHGMVAITNSSIGAFTYTPAAGYAGSDSFTFNVSDGLWTSSAASESIVVATSTAALALSYTGPNNVTVVANQDLVYDLTVTNTDSQQPAINVVLTGTLVSSVTLVSDSAAGATCTTTATSYTCTLASLAAGASWTPSVTVQIGSAGAGQNLTTAVANVNAQNSSNSPSISATVSESQVPTTLSLSYSDLSGLCTPTTKNATGNCPTVLPGSVFPYVVTVVNAGTAPADNVVVVVTIPAGMTFSSPSAGSGTCLIDAAEGKMACALDALAPATGTTSSTNPQQWGISFVATVNSTDSNGQQLISQATATASNTGPTPAATQTLIVGTAIGGGGSLGWLELLALCGLCWFGRGFHRALARSSAIWSAAASINNDRVQKTGTTSQFGP